MKNNTFNRHNCDTNKKKKTSFFHTSSIKTTLPMGSKNIKVGDKTKMSKNLTNSLWICSTENDFFERRWEILLLLRRRREHQVEKKTLSPVPPGPKSIGGQNVFSLRSYAHKTRQKQCWINQQKFNFCFMR